MTGRATHGHTKGRKTTPEFRSWCAMKQRCFDKNSHKYPRYGARGITVCSRWLGPEGFDHFLEDMGFKPTPLHSIDRFPDRDGNYEPGNCRWATPKQQGENRSKPSININEMKTHCPSGHPYIGDNVRMFKNKKGNDCRKCRECEKLRAREIRRKHI